MCPATGPLPKPNVLVILRGPLGVGKTTAARALAAALGAELVSVDQVLERYDLEEWMEDRMLERSFLRANDRIVEYVGPLRARGVPVVVEGNFYYRAPLEDLLSRLPGPHQVFLLTAPLATCVERDQHRVVSHGAEAARAVFELGAHFTYGTEVDARASMEEIVTTLLRYLREDPLSSALGSHRG